MKKLRKDFPSLTEAVEAQAVANLATVDAIENSDHNKEATDKAKEDATKVVDKFVADEEKLADKDKPEEKDIVKEVKKETGLKEGLTLDEAEGSEYPYTFLGSKTHFRRKNLTGMDEIEVSYPAFTVKYTVEPGVQPKPDDPIELGFERDELGRLEVVRDEAHRLEKLFSDVMKKALADKGFDNIYQGGSILVGIPNSVNIQGDKVKNKVDEAYGDGKKLDKKSVIVKLYNSGGNCAYHIESIMHNLDIDYDNITDEDYNKIYDLLKDKYQKELDRYGDDAEVDWLALNLMFELSEGKGSYLKTDDRLDESLCEEVEEPVFDQIYKEVIRIPNVKDENALHTTFAEDNQSATISINIFDELDLDDVYDIIDKYRDGITAVSEDEDRIKIVIDTPHVETAEDRDLYDEIYTQLTFSGRLIPNAGAKGWKVDRGVGYNARHQIGTADADKLGIEVRIPADASAMDSDEDASYVDSLEPAREIARKYADLGVTFDERGEIQSTDPVRVDQILTIWIPKNTKAPERDTRMSDRSRGIKLTESTSNSKYLKELVDTFGHDNVMENKEFMSIISDALDNVDFDNFDATDALNALNSRISSEKDVWTILHYYFELDPEYVTYKDAMEKLTRDFFATTRHIQYPREEVKGDALDDVEESVRTKEDPWGLLK